MDNRLVITVFETFFALSLSVCKIIDTSLLSCLIPAPDETPRLYDIVLAQFYRVYCIHETLIFNKDVTCF